MQRIKSLSTQLANQIAAGEVVERPSSVLKELLENAIDAASSNIEIEIYHGGKSHIRVKDNGKGIDKQDLSLAVSRHATSKISLIDDLNHIVSLGFRGEALASISSISRLSISSKLKGSDKAWAIDTGSDSDFANYSAEVMPAALNEGTLIDVYDLFYNTPARRKFLKTDKTEFRYIEEIFKRIALSHYDISFKLVHNGKQVKKLSVAQDNKLLRVGKLLGTNLVEQLHELNETSQYFEGLGELHLTGWVSKLSYARSQADQQFFYINGRFVRDKLLNHALRQAYQDALPSGQYMAYILYLSIEPYAVDVNVHPSKYEVRFSQPRMIHDFIVSCISRSLFPAFNSGFNSELKSETIPKHQNFSHQVSELKVSEKQPLYYPNPTTPRERYRLSRQKQDLSQYDDKPKLDIAQFEIPTGINSQQESSVGMINLAKEYNLKWKILTQLGSMLVAEQNNKLWLVDCEKIAGVINLGFLQEQLQAQFEEQPILKTPLKKQALLIPQNIILSVKSCDILHQYQEQLKIFSIDYTFSGSDSIMLRGLPKLPFEMDRNLMIKLLVDLLNSIMLEDKLFNPKLFSPKVMDLLAKSINISQNFISKQSLVLHYIEQSCNASLGSMEQIKSCFKCLDSKDLKQIVNK